MIQSIEEELGSSSGEVQVSCGKERLSTLVARFGTIPTDKNAGQAFASSMSDHMNPEHDLQTETNEGRYLKSTEEVQFPKVHPLYASWLVIVKLDGLNVSSNFLELVIRISHNETEILRLFNQCVVWIHLHQYSSYLFLPLKGELDIRS